MNVLLAHNFWHNGQTITGWLEGTLCQRVDNGRFDVLNKAGNKLIDGATPQFLAMLKKRGMIKEDNVAIR